MEEKAEKEGDGKWEQEDLIEYPTHLADYLVHSSNNSSSFPFSLRSKEAVA